MENAPLKSSKDLAMEKIRSTEEIEQRNPLRTTKEIAMEKIELASMEEESRSNDLEKIKRLEKESGLNLSVSIEEMQGEVGKLKTAKEIAMEKAGLANEEKDQKSVPLRTSAEIAMEKVKNMDVKEEKEAAVLEEVPAENAEAEKPKSANEKMEEFFSKEETTGVKNYNASDNEIKDQERQKTTAEKNNEEMAEYFSKEETTAVKDYDKEGKEIKSEIKKETPDNVVDFTKKREEKVAAKIEAGEQQWPVSPEERAKIQKEALDDFVKGLKGKEKVEAGKKWEGDTIMQAMEDFISSQKEQNSVTNAFKNMVSFIRKKGAEINSGKIAIRGAAEEFARKSSGWAAKIFGEKKGQESPEAARIDRIMRGDMRSDNAVKIDEIMGKANELGDIENKEKLKMKLSEANSMDELIQALNGLETITNNEGTTYKALDQQAYIDKLFKTGDPKFLNWITREGDLRKNVKRVFNAESIQKENKKQVAA